MMVSEGCQDPAFSHKNRGLHLGFITRMSGSCWDNGGAIMICQILIGWVDIGFVSAGMFNARFGVIGDQNFSDSTEEIKCMDMGLYP